MLMVQKGINWSELPHHWKNGNFIERVENPRLIKDNTFVMCKGFQEVKCPIFQKDRQSIEKYLEVGFDL